MAVIPMEPFGWLAHFRRQMDEVLDYFATLKCQEGVGECESIPAVDIYETLDTFVVEIELPGFEREDISLRFCYNTLFVEGVKRDEAKAEELNYIRLERHFGRFCRAIELPPTVDMAGARAHYAKGLLSVVFPRLADKKMVIRDIPIE
jgi:HSP20 family protein